jgi:hypothetical protein
MGISTWHRHDGDPTPRVFRRCPRPDDGDPSKLAEHQGPSNNSTGEETSQVVGKVAVGKRGNGVRSWSRRTPDGTLSFPAVTHLRIQTACNTKPCDDQQDSCRHCSPPEVSNDELLQRQSKATATNLQTPGAQINNEDKRLLRVQKSHSFENDKRQTTTRWQTLYDEDDRNNWQSPKPSSPAEAVRSEQRHQQANGNGSSS